MHLVVPRNRLLDTVDDNGARPERGDSGRQGCVGLWGRGLFERHVDIDPADTLAIEFGQGGGHFEATGWHLGVGYIALGSDEDDIAGGIVRGYLRLEYPADLVHRAEEGQRHHQEGKGGRDRKVLQAHEGVFPRSSQGQAEGRVGAIEGAIVEHSTPVWPD